jgi:PAS domain S-box-containing protein
MEIMNSKNLEQLRVHSRDLAFDETKPLDCGMRLLLESVVDYAIYMLDTQGRIATWNAGAERLKGYTSDEVLGRHFSMFFTPKAVAAGLPEKALVIAASDGRFECYDWRQRKGGERFWALVTLTVIHGQSGTLDRFAVITRDMTTQKLLQESQAKQTIALEARVKERTLQLETTNKELRIKNEEVESLLTTIRRELDEKELLLREVHHRVKNNLQVVKSLLRLGARSSGSGDRLDTIQAAVQRIQVIATAHERLYQVPNLDRLTLSTYISEIAEGVIAANADPAIPIQLNMEFDDISLPLDLAIPLGLLVNELLSNCLKHAFPQADASTIWLSARIVPGAVCVRVRDNGKGLPENFDASRSQSMGLRLAQSLAHQLGGQLESSSNHGCQVEAILQRLAPQNGIPEPMSC